MMKFKIIKNEIHIDTRQIFLEQPPNIHQTTRENFEIPTKSFTMSQTLFQSINFGQQAFER